MLRQQLISVAETRQIGEQKSDYKDVLCDHIFSNDFVSRLRQLQESVQRQRSDLAREKAASDKLFAKREKQIEVTMSNFMGIIGGLSGLGLDSHFKD